MAYLHPLRSTALTALLPWLPLLAAAGLAACDGDEEAADGGAVDGGAFVCNPTTAAIQADLLIPRCATATCHSAQDVAAGLDLESDDPLERIARDRSIDCSDRIVLPGQSDYSLLVKKVKFEDPGCGVRMPLGADPLSKDEVACIEQWVSSLEELPQLPDDEPDAGPMPDAGGMSDGGTTVEEDPCGPGEVRCKSSCIAVIAPTASAIHDRILKPSCAFGSCHVGSNPTEGLGLFTMDDLMALVNTPSMQRPERDMIEPGQPDLSYLVNKARGVEMSEKSLTGRMSLQMPRLAPVLCEARIAPIEQWIADGALDDR